jgi:hypothetical protein
MQAAFIHLYNAAKTTPKISADARKYLTTSQKIFARVCSRWPDAVSTRFNTVVFFSVFNLLITPLTHLILQPPIMSLIGRLQNSIDKIHAKKEPDSLHGKPQDVPVTQISKEQPAPAEQPNVPEQQQPKSGTPQMSVGKYRGHDVTLMRGNFPYSSPFL